MAVFTLGAWAQCPSSARPERSLFLNSLTLNHDGSIQYSGMMDLLADFPFPGHKFQKLVSFGTQISLEASYQPQCQDQDITHWLFDSQSVPLLCCVLLLEILKKVKSTN